MNAERPLDGRSIVVTRAAEQARDFTTRLEALGARVLALPVVRFSEPADTTQLDRAIAGLDDFDWLLFTSANAARFFAARSRKLGRHLRSDTKLQCAAVGPITASAAAAEGYRIAYTAREFLGASLAREMGASLAGKRVLLPRSSRAGRDFPDALAACGATVTEAIAYDTGGIGAVDPQVLNAIREARVDVISFFSPSAVENLRREFGASIFLRTGTQMALAAVGPVTAATLRSHGFPVAIVSEEATAESMVAAIADYFSPNRASRARSI